MVLGQSTVNSFKALDGNVESWHDGFVTRQTLSGTFQGRGTVSITFTFHDGSTQTLSAYTDGAPKSLSLTSSNAKSVVRSTTNYYDNRDSNCHIGTYYNTANGRCDYPESGRIKTIYVGDSPQSLGTCQQLDDDEMNVQNNQSALFIGDVKYDCDAAGRIHAHLRGSLNWTDTTIGSSGRLSVRTTFADGTVQSLDIQPAVTPSNRTVNVSVDSTASKSVRTVQLTVFRDQLAAATAVSNFGDA